MKMRLVVALVGLAIGFVFPAVLILSPVDSLGA